MKKGRLPADFLAVISIVVAIFLSYIGINHNVNQRIDALNQRIDASNLQTSEKIDASNRQTEERLDKILTKIDDLNREMGEMKVEMELRFDNIEEGFGGKRE